VDNIIVTSVTRVSYYDFLMNMSMEISKGFKQKRDEGVIMRQPEKEHYQFIVAQIFNDQFLHKEYEFCLR